MEDNDKIINYLTDGRKWSVYIHVVPKEINNYGFDKFYVGVTSQSLNDRWSNGNGYKGQIFYKAIEKYKWENIKHYVIAQNLCEKDASDMEVILIELLHSNDGTHGYNATPGGVACGTACHQTNVYNHNGEFIQTFPTASEAGKFLDRAGSNIIQAAQSHQLINNHQVRFIEDVNNFKNIGKYVNSTYKKVHQFDLYGVYQNTFESLIFAEKVTSIASTTIRKSCCGVIKDKIAGGYIWRYDEDVIYKDGIPTMKFDDINKNFAGNRRVFQFECKTKKFINSYFSITEAEKNTGIHHVLISKVARHKQNKTFGYIFAYIEDVIIDSRNNNIILKDQNDVIAKSRERKEVFQFTLDNNFVKKYSNANETKNFGFSPSSVSCVANGTQKTHKGYLWKYEEDIEIINDVYYIKNFEKIVRDTRKPVYMFSIDKKFIKHFISYADALRYIGEDVKTHKVISSCVKNNRGTAFGYIWKSEDDVIEKDGIFYIVEK